MFVAQITRRIDVQNVDLNRIPMLVCSLFRSPSGPVSDACGCQLRTVCVQMLCMCEGKRGADSNAGVEKETAWKKYTLWSSDVLAN